MIPATVGVALTLVLAGAAYRFRVFDLRGSAIAAAVGIAITLLTDLRWLLLLLVFVILGTAATNVAIGWKTKRGLSESDGKRTGRNVLANGGIPLAAVLITGIVPVTDSALLPLYAGAVATATADTLSSEIGMLGGKPRLLTAPWKKVEPGVDGGVSGLGELAALTGAAAIGIVSAAFFGAPYLVAVVIGGFAGCHVDSFLGATLERRRLLGNEGVNLLATATGGLVALIIFSFSAL